MVDQLGKDGGQRHLFDTAIELAKPHIESINEAIILLEKWTCRRKEIERIELLKASGEVVEMKGEGKIIMIFSAEVQFKGYCELIYCR